MTYHCSHCNYEVTGELWWSRKTVSTCPKCGARFDPDDVFGSQIMCRLFAALVLTIGLTVVFAGALALIFSIEKEGVAFAFMFALAGAIPFAAAFLRFYYKWRE